MGSGASLRAEWRTTISSALFYLTSARRQADEPIPPALGDESEVLESWWALLISLLLPLVTATA